MAFNILIVDDSQTTRAVIVRTLNLAGLPLGELHQAGNGLEALDILKDNWIDVVLSDINMPEMNGIELVDRMAADESLKSIPVVVISTEGSTKRIEELKQKGIHDYIRKPFNPEQVRDIIHEILGVREGS